MSTENHGRQSYRTPGPMTDLRSANTLVDGLPKDVRGLCEAIQGWFVHVFWARAHNYEPSTRQSGDVRIRDVESMLQLLADRNPAPLTSPRPFEDRVLTDCRGHSVMLTALLIHAGFPARSRCGFARYF